MTCSAICPIVARLAVLVVLAVAGGAMSRDALAQEALETRRVDVQAVQGVLAVQGLDGWLLAESKGQNSIAQELVAPSAPASKQWFYFIPATGEPTILVHRSDRAAFEAVPGIAIEYSGYRDLKSALRTLLKGASTVAMEYAPNSGIPSLTRVDSGTADLVKKSGVDIESSAELVQFAKSLWGPSGRLAHYVAVHHLSKLRVEALQFIAERIQGNRPVTEQDVQVFVESGMKVRGLKGSASVAAGSNTARPNYSATSRTAAPIKQGDLIVVRLQGAMESHERPIYASLSWVAVASETVPERYARAFSAVKQSRDAVVSLLRESVSKRRLVKGFQAHQRAREILDQAGMGARFPHRTGHSLDTSAEGDGANLDDQESHDTRTLVVGSGFTIGPGVYIPGDFGIQLEIDAHVVQGGVEVTTPLQDRITTLF